MDLGARDSLRDGMMGLEMPFDQIVKNQQPQMPPRPMMPPQQPPQQMGQQMPQQAPQMPQGAPQLPQGIPQGAPQPPMPQQARPPMPPQGRPPMPQGQGEMKYDPELISKYNGKVDIKGEEIEVKDGQGTFHGEPFYVNDDGTMVLDKRQLLVGHIEDGEMKLIQDEHIQELKKKGH